MIRIARGAEPPDLRKERYYRLSKALLARARNADVLPDKYDFTGYECARHTLYLAQNYKCAYCERHAGLKELPTEHFRPKDGAARLRGVKPDAGPGKWDTDCYWWLAWTWENLLFSCKTCNGTSHKGNYFPIHGAPLAVGSADIRAEDALIVDPSFDDPLDHVRWRPLLPAAARDDWEWAPVAVGPKGKETIEAFKLLNQEDLIPTVSAVVQNEIVKPVKDIEAQLALLQRDQAEANWKKIQETRLYKEAHFLGAKWSALVYLRDLPGSPLKQLPEPPRPGAMLQPWVVPVGLPAAPAGIPHDAWVRLLAGEELDEAIYQILRAGPLTLGELRGLLDMEHSRFSPSSSSLRVKLDELVAGGHLQVQGDRYAVL